MIKFTRIFNEKEIQKKTIFKNHISENNNLSDNKEKNIENLSEKKQEKVENKHSEAN